MPLRVGPFAHEEEEEEQEELPSFLAVVALVPRPAESPPPVLMQLKPRPVNVFAAEE